MPSWLSCRSAVLARFSWTARSYGTGRASSLLGIGRDELVGPVLGHERLDLQAELVQGPLLELLQPEPLLGAGDLVAVHDVHQAFEGRRQLAHLGADDLQLGLPRGLGLLGGLPAADGGGQGVLDALQGGPGPRRTA